MAISFYATLDTIDYEKHPAGSAASVIVMQDGRLCMQRRPYNAVRYPNLLSLFGGMAEAGETLGQTLLREIKEEIEADLNGEDVVFLGAHGVKDDMGQTVSHARFFWRDIHNKIGQCHEGAIEIYDNAAVVLRQNDLHPSVRWSLEECLKRGLIAA